MSILSNRSITRIAGNVTSGLYALTIVLQLLLAAGILPVTMAWGGREPELTSGLRIASLVSAVLLLGFIYLIRRRAGLMGETPIPMFIKILAWLITAFSALNLLGIIVSLSVGEQILFGPISFLLLVSNLLVSLSKPDSLSPLA